MLAETAVAYSTTGFLRFAQAGFALKTCCTKARILGHLAFIQLGFVSGLCIQEFCRFTQSLAFAHVA
jgi:hypothetical protein